MDAYDKYKLALERYKVLIEIMACRKSYKTIDIAIGFMSELDADYDGYENTYIWNRNQRLISYYNDKDYYKQEDRVVIFAEPSEVRYIGSVCPTAKTIYRHLHSSVPNYHIELPVQYRDFKGDLTEDQFFQLSLLHPDVVTIGYSLYASIDFPVIGTVNYSWDKALDDSYYEKVLEAWEQGKQHGFL